MAVPEIDGHDEVAARSRAQPAGRPAGGLKAGGDLGIQLYLDTGGLRASGYRVYMFYQ